MFDHQFKYDIQNKHVGVFEYQLEYFGPFDDPNDIFAHLSSLWSIIDEVSKIKFVQYLLLVDSRNLVKRLLSTKIMQSEIESIVVDLGSIKILSLFKVFKDYANGKMPKNYALRKESHINLDIRFRNTKKFEKKINNEFNLWKLPFSTFRFSCQ